MHAEVVLFTAGLEDYAKPIADELDRRYGDVFHHRLYRPATRNCSAYPCLKVYFCAPHSHFITTAPRYLASQSAATDLQKLLELRSSKCPARPVKT